MLGVGSIPFCPLARGLCSRPHGAQSTRGQLDNYHQGYMGFGSEAIINRCVLILHSCDAAHGSKCRIEELAGKKGVSMAQVSIAWLLHKGVTAPIVGTTNMANLQDIIGASMRAFVVFAGGLKLRTGAIHVSLSDEEIKFLEEPYVPRPINGHA